MSAAHSSLPTTALPPTEDGSAWAPFRRPLFRALWVAALASNIGMWMQTVGAAWLMTSLTPSATLVALVQAVTTLPMVLLALPAGALADIVDGRRLLLDTQAWMLAAVLGLGALTLLGLTGPSTLLAMTFLFGIGTAMGTPAWQAITLDVVPRPEMPAAVALNAVSINVARAIGPTVGGLLVAAAGPGPTFLLTGISFLVSIVLVYRWQRQPRESALPSEHFFDAMQAGARYVRYSPDFRAALVRTGVFMLCGSAPWALLPIVARRDLGLGALGYGVLLGCLGVGAVGGAILLPRVRQRVGVEAVLAAATVVFALMALALAYVRALPVLYVVLVAGGAAWLAVLSCMIVAGQASIAGWVKARAMAVQLLVFFGGMTVGSILWGAVSELAGLPLALTCSAAGLVLGLAARARWPLPSGAAPDLTPAPYWPEPELVTQPAADRGPVGVTVEYRIDPTRGADFARAMGAVRLERLRAGAMRWTLYSDPTDPGRWLEALVVKSWVEHERAHERVTVADQASEACARAFHVGERPPLVSHLIAEPVPN